MHQLSPFGSAVLETLLTLVPGEAENRSADGVKFSSREIVFVAESDGNQGVYIVNEDGKYRRKITTIGKDYIENYRESPKQLRITFHHGPNGHLELHFTHEDGTQQKKIIDRSFGGQTYWIPDYILQMMDRIVAKSGSSFG
jgi:hypothetical protein